MRLHFKIRTVLVLMVIVSLGSCAKRTSSLRYDNEASDDPLAEETFREARDQFRRNKIDVADEGFAKLIREFPDDPLVRSAWIYRARICLERQDPERARTYLKKVGKPKDALYERAILYDGVALHQLGQHAEAINRLKPLIGTLTDETETLTLLKTIWKAAEVDGAQKQTIYALDTLLQHMPQGRERRETLKHLEQIIAKIEDTTLLQELIKELPEEQSAWSIVMTRMASIHLQASRFDESARLLEIVEKKRQELKSTQKTEGTEIEDDADVVLKNIGLLIPLSGRARLIGESVMRGVLLAAKDREINVIIRDSGGDPQKAVEEVEHLVTKENVSAIIGPLDANAAAAAAEKVEELGVPLLALSSKERLPESGTFVFRPFASNRSEVETLVSKAKANGSRRFGILYPDSGYGRGMRGIFAGELLKADLELVVETSYPADTKTFASVAEDLAKQSIDTLFVPDSASRIALLVPALAAVGIWSSETHGHDDGAGRVIQLLFPSSGYDGDLKRRAGRYLNSALFSRFFIPDATPLATDFTKKYRIEYGAEPNYLSAFGYDSIVLVGLAIQKGMKSRAEIRDWLSKSASYDANQVPTLTRLRGFSKDGSPLLEPYLYQFNDGQFELVY